MNKEIELLHNKLEAQDKIINEQALEIARLKEQLENDIDRYEDTISYQLGFDKGKEYLQQKIDKAIEYCKSKIKEQKELTDYSKYYLENYDKAINLTHSTHSGVMLETIKSTTIKRYEDILEILGDKE